MAMTTLDTSILLIQGRDDAELAPVLPQLLALVAQVRYQPRLGQLARDAVGWSGL